MNKSLLSSNCIITIFQWFRSKELEEFQKMCKKFYDYIIPVVMWRLKTFPYITNKQMFYFKQNSRNFYLYDVIQKVHSKYQIDMIFP